MVFRLMLALAVLAGMAVALVATTQSAHAYGAYASVQYYSQGIVARNEPNGRSSSFNIWHFSTTGFPGLGATQAEADAEALRLCRRYENLIPSFQVASPCVVDNSRRFLNECVSVYGRVSPYHRGPSLISKAIAPRLVTLAVERSGRTTMEEITIRDEVVAYYGKSPVGGTRDQSNAMLWAACNADRTGQQAEEIGPRSGVCLSGPEFYQCDHTCGHGMEPKEDQFGSLNRLISGCRPQVESDCIGNTPVFENGACRGYRPDECVGDTPFWDDGICRKATQRDCTGGTPIFENNDCRPAVQSDCSFPKDYLDDGGFCRPRQMTDCPADKPILHYLRVPFGGSVFGSTCRARIQSDCRGETPILDNGECRARTSDDAYIGVAVRDTPTSTAWGRASSDLLVLHLNAPTPFQSWNWAIDRCREERFRSGDCKRYGGNDDTDFPTSAKCAAFIPTLDPAPGGYNFFFYTWGTGNTEAAAIAAARQKTAGSEIGTPIVADCIGTGTASMTKVYRASEIDFSRGNGCPNDKPILRDDGSLNCRALASDSDCPANTPIFDNGNCRARTAGDCTGGTPLFEGGECRARQQSDCTGNTPILDSGSCRTRTAADCTGNTPILDSGECRAEICTTAKPISENGICRARTAGDCTGGTPVLDSGNCRARTALDCTGNTPIFASGECRTREAADCTGATPVFDNGECRERRANDCIGNTPILDAGICRTRTAADCTGNTPILDGSQCRARQTADCTGGTQVLDRGRCRARVETDCIDPTPNFVNGQCESPRERINVVLATTTISAPLLTPRGGKCDHDGIIGSVPVPQRNICFCPDGQEVLSDGSVLACADPLPVFAANYAINNCILSGWNWKNLRDVGGAFRQLCLTPYSIAVATLVSPAGSSDNRLLEIAETPA